MSRATSDPAGLAIGCQYENQERNLAAYIDEEAELIRYTLVVMPAEFVDHGTYTTATMTLGDVPLYTHTALIKGKRRSSKRDFEATGMLQKALRRWLYENRGGSPCLHLSPPPSA